MTSIRNGTTTLLCLLMLSATPAWAQTAAVVGRVIDARTRQPLARVVVHAANQSVVVETDVDGRFTLPLPPGTHTIMASMIGYAVLQRAVEVGTQGPHELVFELAEGAGSFEERVTVAGVVPREADRAPAGAILHGRELQALRGVMLDDPLRAVQALPSATSTDDFYSEFAVRGSSFRSLGLTVDGIPSPYLIHSIHAVGDGGSIAMVNSEALGAASLLPGSYPQRVGRRLGAHIDLATRDGSRERLRGRAGLSGTSANVIGEGPLPGGRGAWVATIRRSYLDFLLERIDPDNSVGFGFTDALAKVSYDISDRQQLQLLTVLGRSVFDEEPERLGVNDEALATSRGWLTAATWRYTPGPRLSVSQRLYVTGMDFRNINTSGALLDRGDAKDVGWRPDIVFAPAPGWIGEAGGDVVWMTAGRERQRTLDGANAPTRLDDFRATGRAASAYAQVTARIGRLALTPGARLDRWQPTRLTSASPWLTAEYTVDSRTRIRAGAGVYRQFPALPFLHGLNGAGHLRPERATHADVSLSRTVGGSTTLHATAFGRDERDVLRAVDAEARRQPDGSVTLGRGDARWDNRLEGRAHGVELVLRREAPDGLSGWIAYGYAEHRYTDAITGERFWSDHDQRHTLSVYALYRLSNRTSLGAKFRYGSNYPLTGYLGAQPVAPNAPPLFGGQRPLFLGLTDVRNSLRLPAYARLDLRADRAVTWGGRRVTLFAEVANVLNRRNERNVPYSVDRLGRVTGATDSLMPIVPSAGFVVEF